MSYLQLAYLHLFTVLPAFAIGTYMLMNKKGTPKHRVLGKVYMVLMLVTAAITLFMPAHVGGRLFDHFGWIHIFSLLVFYHVPNAIIAIKKGNIARHKSSMVGLYVGGLIIAGSFAFFPGRLLHSWLFT